MGRVRHGAKAGASIGAAAGFGYGEGAEGTIASTAAGGVAGGVLGGALPVVGEVVRNRAGGLRRMMGRDPELPRRIVGETIAADANTPAAAGQMMDAARSRGTPAMLADTGENARGLLASVSRQPGASRTIARDAVIARQEGQADRIGETIRRDLGPTSNPHQISEELIQTARTQSAPLYEQAYAGPTPSPERIRALLARPGPKAAMSRAHRIAAEEGVDPTKIGFDLDDAGEVILTREPSMQTLDYIKRGLDDVVETYRDANGVLRLNGEGRSINNTLRTLINEMDRVNPAYAQARAAYAGPVKAKDALGKGLKALGKDADDISVQTARMTPFELDHYRLGVRRAMSNLVNSKGDYADKINALLGTPKKRQALERLFGGQADFRRFIATLGDERAAGLTYRSVATGSQTAERSAADAITGDTGLAESAMDAALRGGKDGIWSALVNAVSKLREVDRFGAGEAGERTRQGIAALLTETDPAVLQDLIAAANRAAEMQGARSLSNTRNAVRIGQDVGRGAGVVAGNMTQQPIE